ncbi:MAG: NADH-quinone oxidoreductase subunit B family protein [Candidatus Odinarchaeia archaeon]
MALKQKARLYSPWVFHAHCGGCNGCGIEIAAALSPRYDPERIGVQLHNNPRHADIILVEGIVPKQQAPFLRRIYEQCPDPKVVVAIGSCAISGGVFLNDDDSPNYAQAGPVEKVIPVDVNVPGCAPKPEAIIDGIIKAILILANKK